MPVNENLFTILNMVTIGVIFTLIATLIFKMEQIKHLRAGAEGLKKSLDEMDEQAKLIVRTDMELNKTQEELDKKITSLYALQRLSHTISTTLEEKLIFGLIQPAHMEDLSFEKTCAFLWNEEEKKFIPQLYIGYAQEEINTIEPRLNLKSTVYLNFIKQQKTISSLSGGQDVFPFQECAGIFEVNEFILSPILPKEGSQGFILAGTQNTDITITEGDEELITIVGNQIGQALENARLFEKTWRAQHELEKKVEERTRALQLALNEVKLMNQRKTDFISAVSHELRTPLTSIKGYASILLTGKLGALPEDVRLRLEKMNRHSDELTALVNDLLDIARIESGRVVMKLEARDLKKAGENVLDLLSVQFKEKQIEFSLNIPADAALVMADAAQINRVLINLVGNALKFTPQGGKISLSSSRVDNRVEIAIADTGCGIPEESLSAVFEEFYRVDNQINQQAKGTGLGLALVKRIVEAHGGRIWAESKINNGSTFKFTLPSAAV